MMEPYKAQLPAVVISRDGSCAVFVIKKDGERGGGGDFAGREVDFAAKLDPRSSIAWIRVVQDDMTAVLWDSPNQSLGWALSFSEAFLDLALVSIGEYLDNNPHPNQPEGDELAAQVQIGGGIFEVFQRSPAGDSEILQYISAKLCWSWQFSIPDTRFFVSDAVRLGVGLPEFARLALLEEGHYWEKVSDYVYRPRWELLNRFGSSPPRELQFRQILASPGVDNTGIDPWARLEQPAILSGREDRAKRRVFVSYSHDSHQHKERVLALAQTLRGRGIDAWLDQYESFPQEGWPRWMARQLREAQFVLVVASETYYRRFIGDEVPGTGLGASWEGAIITNDLYRSQGRQGKFIPVVFEESDAKWIPDPLLGATRYNVAIEADVVGLRRYLTDQPAVIPAPLGVVEPLPPLDDGRAGSRSIDSSTSAEEPQGPYRLLRSGDRIARLIVPLRAPQSTNVPLSFRQRFAELSREAAVRNSQGSFSYPVHFRGMVAYVRAFAEEVETLGAEQVMVDGNSTVTDVWFEYTGDLSPAEMKKLATKHNLEVVHCGAILMVRPE